MIDSDSIAPALVFTPIILYVLYVLDVLIRSAVRDGILQADERRKQRGGNWAIVRWTSDTRSTNPTLDG